MKNKFWFLFKESLKKKICSKWFKWVNLILLIIIAALINIDSIIKFFGGDFDEPINMYIIDEMGVYNDFENDIKNSYTSVLESYNLNISLAKDDEEKLVDKIVSEENDDIIVKITPSDNYFDVEIISFDYIDSILFEDINISLNNVKRNRALLESGIDLELLDNIQKNVTVVRTLLNEDLDEDSELMQTVGSLITIIFILPFFFLIIVIVQMIGAEINEEKTSKSMEIIISSVSPQVHFLTKIASANVFAVCQGALLILYVLIGMLIRIVLTPSSGIGALSLSFTQMGEISNFVVTFVNSNIFKTIINGIPMFIILSILSFILYSLFTGILASMTTSMEDYQQLQTPIMVFLMIGYYLAIMSTIYDGSILVKVLSFIPFISGILSPVLYSLGELSLIHLYICAGIMIVTIFVMYKYGMRIYKVGILNYSSSKLWKKIFKSIKN